MSAGGSGLNNSALVPPKEKPAPGVMARRHITSEPSTSNIGLRTPAASVAAVAIRVNGERSRPAKARRRSGRSPRR
jgi:hypothetical protein